MTISTWSDIQAYVYLRKLPMVVMRYDDEPAFSSQIKMRGKLISTATGATLAESVDEAKRKLEEGL